jgi:eukaryotic-like serine/threonine-protein kinase
LTGMAPRPGQPRLPLAEAVPGVPAELAHAVTAGLQAVPARRPDAGQFADLLYAACAPVPVRFPVGLVLSDADIAAVLGGAQGTGALAPGAPAPTAPGPAATARQDPFVLGLAGDVADDHAGAGQPAGSSGSGPGIDDSDDLDDERDGRRSLAVFLAGGLALLLVAGAVIGGVLLGRQAGTDHPATLAGAGEAARPDNAAAVPAPRGPGQEPPARGNSTADPRTSAAPQPDRTATPDGHRSRGAQAPAGGTVESWQQVLADLDTRRAKAFAESDSDLLRSVYVNGSELMAKDQAEIDKCVRAGCHVEGLTFDIIRLAVVSSGDGRTVLKVVDQMQAYTVVSDTGERTDQPPGEVTTRQITLQRSPGGRWMISRIVAD